MFSGTHYATLDQKGRFTLPGALRKHFPAGFGGTMFVTKHPSESYLLIYTAERWAEFVAEIDASTDADEYLQAFHRLLIQYATEVDLDKNGRLLIPNLLRDYAQLEKNLLVRGHLHRIEVWNESSSQADEASRVELLRSEEGIAKLRTVRF